MLGAKSIAWKGREAARLSNGVVELTALTKGGHLAEFRFLERNGPPSQNVFWEAPWMASEPTENRAEELSQTAGFTGHGVCLDYFGAPSAEEAAAGLPIHGEAAAAHWNATMPMDTEEIACQWNVQLPVAQLMFARKIRLGDHESVAYVEETVSNNRGVDHACHWVQHATFSPPFLNASESTLAASALRGITSPSDYEDGSLLARNREFSWPNAPTQETPTSTAMADLRQPFAAKGLGFLAGVQLDPRRKVEYLLAVNWKLRLGVGYCFRREDFPWMAVWEENCTRQGNPWNGKVQARGMEFGTTPLPLGREETFRRGRLFDTPCWCVIPANGTRTARYSIFLFTVPNGMNSVQNVEAKDDAIVLYDEHANPTLSIPSHGCEEFLSTKVHNSSYTQRLK